MGAYCENYSPAQQVLQAHNPRVDVFKDVRDPELLNLKAPIVTFGFPCQDLSVAGNRAGLDGERSGLFHTCMAVVRATYPDLVVVENVPRLLRYQDVVDAQFHDAGFETAWVTRQRRRPRAGRARDLGGTERTGLRRFDPGVLPRGLSVSTGRLRQPVRFERRDPLIKTGVSPVRVRRDRPYVVT